MTFTSYNWHERPETIARKMMETEKFCEAAQDRPWFVRERKSGKSGWGKYATREEAQERLEHFIRLAKGRGKSIKIEDFEIVKEEVLGERVK